MSSTSPRISNLPVTSKTIAGVLLFWVLFGLLYANVIYLSMMGHGHSWGRLVLWQLVNWVAWAALTPAVVALGRRFPLEPRWRSASHLAVHGIAGLGISLLHLVPLAWATSVFQPYAPVVGPRSFLGAYRSSLGSWFRLDVVIYWGILAVWTAWRGFARARDRERRTRELEMLLTRRELEVLRLQLHPHFLFNTLHTAIALIREGNADDASRVLTGLSDLLRRVLDPSLGQEVPLEEEIRFLRQYLEIQRIRYPDLRIDLEIDPAAETSRLPSLVLQPLVENAVEHGAPDQAGERWIRIRARRANDSLLLVVENPVGEEEAMEGRGVGLSNTLRRLRELYGPEAGVRLARTEEGVMEANLRIPWSAGSEEPVEA